MWSRLAFVSLLALTACSQDPSHDATKTKTITKTVVRVVCPACPKKTRCEDMASCAEAVYHLRTCHQYGLASGRPSRVVTSNTCLPPSWSAPSSVELVSPVPSPCRPCGLARAASLDDRHPQCATVGGRVCARYAPAATIATRMGGDAGLPGTAAPARGQLRRALERDPTEGRGPPRNPSPAYPCHLLCICAHRCIYDVAA